MRCSSRLSSAIAPRRAEVELGVLRDAPAATSEKRGTFVGGMDRYRAVMAEVVSDAGWQAGDAADGGAVPFSGAVGQLFPGNQVGTALGLHVLRGSVAPAGLLAFL